MAGKMDVGRRVASNTIILPAFQSMTIVQRRVACKAQKELANCRIVGVGSSVPATIVTNDDLAKFVDTTDEWIRSRTGIKRRHVLNQGETLSSHAAKAAQKALEMAGVNAADIDMIIMATSTPDDVFGSACQVQALIGAPRAVAFDMVAACSGFVVALVTAAQWVRGGHVRNVLVIGADAMSRITDWRDRGTCILFGDGSGAVVLSRADAPGSSCSLLGADMHSDGAGQSSLYACVQSPAGAKPLLEDVVASAGISYSNVMMNGSDVFKFAVRAVPTVVEAALSQAGLDKSAIDWLVLHQANQRILDSAAAKLGVPAERVVSVIEEYGNTSAASIPLALDTAVRDGRIKQGDVVALAGFGAGLTWASAIMRWG